MLAVLATTALSFLLLAIAFVPLERAFPARRQPILRPGLAVDLAFFVGQYVVFSSIALATLVAIRVGILGVIPAPVARAIAQIPFVVRAVLAVVLGDACVYGFHRACHASSFLFRFHAVHHTSERLDFVAAHREHPLDGLCTQLAVNLPAFAMGFQLDRIAWFLAARGLWAVFIHANVRVPLGPLRWIFGAPELHHLHHARGGGRVNFSNLAPWLDVLFGTYAAPPAEESYPIGLDRAAPRTYLGLLASPFALPGFGPGGGPGKWVVPTGTKAELERTPLRIVGASRDGRGETQSLSPSCGSGSRARSHFAGGS